jgi:hypothetical protein
MPHEREDIGRIFGDSLKRLVPVEGFRQKKDLSPEEYLALETAEAHKAQYVYFRHDNDRPSPARYAQAYVYDYTVGPLFARIDRAELADLHKELWNACPVALFIVFLHDEIQIFSSLRAPKIKDEGLQPAPLEVITLAAKAQRGIDLFHARLRELDIGTFWDNSKNPNLRHAKREESVYGLMLQQLRDTRRRLIHTKKLDKRHANRLLVMALLVRYLEERTDSQGHGVFPKAGETRNGKTYQKGFFEEFAHGATDFTNLVRANGNVVGLFDRLSSRFQGDAFELTREERAYLMQADLSGLADFLAGQPGKQRVFWPLYSFNHLPVELISNIYEEFLGADKKKRRSEDGLDADDNTIQGKSKNKGIVYTPPFLVDFLLAESMPLAGPTQFRVLDPSCGSGVFLVGAYRRLIARWRLANKWQRPSLETLQSLLRDNIHGVDLDPDAVSLTIFSLCIALCSELEPMEIWKKLHFDRLRGKTIVEGDFFEQIEQGRWSKPPEKFDLVIGNPPFAEKLTPNAETINARLVKANTRPELPNKQIALLFLEQSMSLLKPKGLTCLIEPAAPLLYNQGGQAFRKSFLQRFDVPQVLDFTHACRVIFGTGGDVAFAAIFAYQRRPSRPVLHVTVRRTRSVKEHIAFELDRYDFHLVSRNVALNEPSVWKANLIGGGRIAHLARRLNGFPKLQSYLARRKHRWSWGEGFIVSNAAHVLRYKTLKARRTLSNSETDELRQLEKRCQTASFITNKLFLPTKAFRANGIDEDAIGVVKTRYFSAPRDKMIYSGPHLLIGERAYADGTPVALRMDHLTFKHDVFAIHAPKEDLSELKQMERRLKHNETASFALLIGSGRLAVNKSSAILAADLLNLPYPKAASDLELSDWETTLRDDALKHWLDYRRNGEKSRIMQDANDSELNAFGATYTDFLSSIYRGLSADKPRKTPTHVCYPFFFKKPATLPDSLSSELDNALQELTQRQHRPGVRITRILRIYEGDVIYLIKPKPLRYWLRSMAIRDADDTFAELTSQGL